MQQLGDKHHAGTTFRALRHTSIRLKRQPETAGMRAEVIELRKKTKDAHETWLEAREERIAGTVEIVYLDSKVNDGVMDIARGVLVITKGRRDDPRYTILFVINPSDAVKPLATPEQDRFVHGLVDRLLSDERFVTLRPAAEQLAANQAALAAAVQQRSQLYVTEAKTAGDMQAAMDEAKRRYNQLFPRLQLMFPDDRALVESFFMKLSAPKRRSQALAETPSETTEPDAAEETPEEEV